MKRQKKTGELKLVKCYVDPQVKKQLEDLSAEQQKSVSFLVTEMIESKLELILKLDLQLEEEEK